ncbi:Mrp/NBP35 family ATP-binding protein [Bacillaceae bacterium SIJ1]|uniref:Mrp/NBP35 family ATP-binding protein n=1 Tax=Litoribacterium kuwaitense TaxID=1398745 RepID=UPI0013EA6B9F|nr:Mrp/NBP35 family ATP-binding protein [Litoribacterium kuwaitense]NGP46657.1 Mrp/NBP35 family ATP-binding protein [Litoribacterium kuwaitense]
MLNEAKMKEIVYSLTDPFLHKSLKATGGVREVKWDEEKRHASLKIALQKINSKEQMDLQQKVVEKLKAAGAETVGLRFTEMTPEEVEAAGGTVRKTPELLREDTKTTFIAIASGKGGVGKSTVTVNLAVSLARLGKKVGVIDADIYGFSVPDMMGVTERPMTKDNRIYPVERFGVKVISTAFFVEDNTPVVWRGPMLGKMLNSFFKEVEWGELDYLLLDLPPGTGDMALDVHQLLPASKEIIVTTPHPTAAFVAARAGAMALQTEHDILGVIENMSYFESKVTGEKEHIFGRGGGKKLAEELQTELLGQLPLEQPDWEREDFSPSIYQEGDGLYTHYNDIAQKIIDKTT